MTINTWLMIVALTAGLGTIGSDSTTSSTKPPGEYENNCWINGTWYNPCPSDEGISPWTPEPPPETQPPS